MVKVVTLYYDLADVSFYIVFQPAAAAEFIMTVMIVLVLVIITMIVFLYTGMSFYVNDLTAIFRARV